MKRITLIAALVAAFSAQAQTITVGGFQMTPLPATAHAQGDTVDMVWRFSGDGVQWEQRLAVTGCAAGTGLLTFIGYAGGSLPWAGVGDDIARITCNSIKGQS